MTIDTFWATFLAELVAALVAGGITFGAALLVFRLESNRQTRARAEEALDALWIRRATAVYNVLEALHRETNAPPASKASARSEAYLAIDGLLLDRTSEGYDVFRWTRWRLGNVDPTLPGTEATRAHIRAQLLGWVSLQDSAGALSSIRSDLRDRDAANAMSVTFPAPSSPTASAPSPATPESE